MNWTQFEVNATDNATRFEWRNTNGRENLVMLNSDMALVLNISDKLDETHGGECPCRYNSCGANEVGKVFVEAYADDNQLWLTDFAAAFRKMILTGYDANTLEVLAEDWYITTISIFFSKLLSLRLCLSLSSTQVSRSILFC